MQIKSDGILDAGTRTKYETRARVLGALANPVRLFIVDQLEEGEQSVGDLARRTELDLSTVSRHLRVLRTAGIIGSEKRGRQIVCRLRTPCILGWARCIEGVLQAEVRDRLRSIR